MTDPDLLAQLAAERAAEERALSLARESFTAGQGPRWVRVGRHLVDLAPPARAVAPPPEPEIIAQAPVECCRACGRPLIGVG